MTERKRKSVQKNPLEGVEYADEPPVQEAGAVPERSEERDRLNNQSQSAKDFLRSQQISPELHVPKPHQAEVVPLSPAEEEKLKPKVYKVTEGKRLPGYNMPTGKIFSANEYDVDALILAGVKLEEVEPSSITLRPRI